jgi:hypothetical protein
MAEHALSRTMHDKILRRRLMKLPKVHNYAWEVKFTTLERFLYRAVEGRFGQLINANLKEKDPRKNLTYLIVQLTRLRQFVQPSHTLTQSADSYRLTAHPLIVEKIYKVRYFLHCCGQVLNWCQVIFKIQELEEIQEKLRRVGTPDCLAVANRMLPTLLFQNQI